MSRQSGENDCRQQPSGNAPTIRQDKNQKGKENKFLKTSTFFLNTIHIHTKMQTENSNFFFSPFGKDYRLALLELDIPELAVQLELVATVRVSMDSTEDGRKGRPRDSMDWWLLREAGMDREPQQ